MILKSKSVVQLASLRNKKNIKDVTVLKDTIATALFGHGLESGVILIIVKSKKVFRKIKRINFGDN
jgi:hypothetical protein